MWVNPFESDIEEQEQPLPTPPKKKPATPRTKKTPTTASKTKKAAVPPQPSFVGADSESDDEPLPCAQPPKRKRIQTFPDSEDDLEPVRASALKNFFSRRTGTSGSSFQSDPTRRGEYYVELRISNARELESRQLAAKDQCKLALINTKIRVDENSAIWKSVSKLVTDTKEQFKSVRPVLYSSQY